MKLLSKKSLSSFSILPEIIAILLAFLISALILLFSGYSPLVAFSALFRGAFGSKNAWGQTLTQATPILFTALAFLLTFRTGIFNIGVEGQFLMGAIASALAGIYFSGLPAPLHIALSLLAGGVMGALWGLIPALLKAYLGVHEVITTMMMSYIASYLTSYLVNYPFKAPGWVAQTEPVAKSALLPKILPPTQLSLSFIIALFFSFLVSFFLFHTYLGFQVRAVGLNPEAAENKGIAIKNRQILAFLLSGFIAGIGGGGEILGVHGRFVDGFSPGYGWDGIAVGLVGKLHPGGCILASILFGMLRAGGMTMTRVTKVPLDLSLIIQSLVIILVAAPYFIKTVIMRRKDL
ncbi:ABC transporter permease [Candidatus Sordicultor fermentans]|jgi:simple sugar transport system permease protein|uniref:ABC transporter permease n=1 Tax=Candidatus Sordicultor fermentans TaxID=1953203 RepID=UPI00169F7261|nr:ABC transporter permease [Atribacterota bacterium]NLY05808.1 ABC transporter permease [Candidatus Atribacteria bacterium]HOA99330.1 ABC transporter permease [Candidatus Atribacteria bacterium]HOQ51233.1 ABC transporter permease [Candidatus Atribacteria bacterium]HPZ40549.1 ABC transporter permease [Candidatus Atribacteria bacterium]